MTITRINFECDGSDTVALWLRYDTQTNPQPVFLEVDFEERTASVVVDPEIGNGVPERVWNGRTIRFAGLPSGLLPEAANRVLTACYPMIDELDEHHEIFWNGSNHVGKLDARGEELAQEIEEITRGRTGAYDDHDSLVVWDASEWFANDEAELIVKLRKGEKVELGDTDVDGDGNPMLLTGVEKFLEDLRVKAREVDSDE